MSYPQQQPTTSEVRYVSRCSPVFWGVVLVLIGIAALLPYDLSRYVWPAVAFVTGLWLLFGPLDRRREGLNRRFDDPSNRM